MTGSEPQRGLICVLVRPNEQPSVPGSTQGNCILCHAPVWISPEAPEHDFIACMPCALEGGITHIEPVTETQIKQFQAWRKRHAN